MTTIKSKDIDRDIDYAGYPIDTNADYVIDHYDDDGQADYARYNPCNRGENDNQDAGEFAYLFK